MSEIHQVSLNCGSLVTTNDNIVTTVTMLDQAPRISAFRSIYENVRVTSCKVRFIQTYPGTGSGGLIFFGLIPSSWNRNNIIEQIGVARGTLTVPQSFQETKTHEFDVPLTGLELELNQIAMRGAKPQLLIGSSGIKFRDGEAKTIGYAFVDLILECSGRAY